MPTLTELNDKRGRLVEEARSALEDIKANTEESRAKELEERHDKIMAEFDKLDATIAREKRVAEIEARAEEERAKQRPIPQDGKAKGQDEGAAPEYRAVFYKMLAAGGDLSDLSREERAVLKRGHEEVRIQTAGTTTAGGFTVPTELAGFIVKSMAATGPMYDPAVTAEMNTSAGNPIKVPTVDDTSKTAGLHTEGTALTDDASEDVTFGQKSLDAYVYDTEFVKLSMELLQDSIFNLESFLGTLLGERLGRRANTALTTGTGSSQPNGIVTASTLGVTAASTSAVTSDEIIDLQHSVDPAYRTSPRARFMFNDSTLKVIRKLKDGDGQYIWNGGNLANGVSGTLLGMPYSVNQAVASISTGNKAIIFGDFGKYYVRKVGAPMIGVLRERFWPDVGMAGLIRFDGELSDTAAVKHLILA